jgi:nucleoside-diphosphate-sugar epimerase
MRVFLTGGTGLIGSHIAEQLRARGDDVVALSREDSDTRFLKQHGCTVAIGDVREPHDELATHMAGCDALVHAAALVYGGESWPSVRAVNVEGTTNVLRATSTARVPAAVHLSSVAVYGRTWGPVDEDTPTDSPLQPGDLYARSKREAEAVARSEATNPKGGVRLTILRLAAVYGERDRLLVPRLVSLVCRPVVPVLGPGHNSLPIVYAGNAAAAATRCLDQPAARQVRTYDLGLDHRLTQKGFILGMARALGTAPRLVHVPGGLARGAAAVGEKLGLSVPGAADLSLSRFTRLVLDGNPYPSRRIRRELDWKPPFGHDEGIGRTVAWLRAGEGPTSRKA